MSVCREWQGTRDKDGYGLIYRLGNMRRVHRYIVELVDGPIPPGKIVMHTCDNPPCFLYAHLVLGTPGDNNRDRSVKGRTTRHGGIWQGPRLVGERHSQAKLTQADVDEIRVRIARGEVQRTIAREFGVSPATITMIKQGKNWRQREDGT